MARRGQLAMALVLLLGLVTACGAGAIFENVGENLEGTSERAAFGDADTLSDAAPAPGSGSGAEDEGSPLFADLADRKIVKTGEITLEVANVSSAVGVVRAMALELDGYVGGSRAGEADQAATLTLRIPADRFDAALDRLRSMDGTVIAEATKEEDVTSSIVDLEARIANLEASETQYRALVERAEEIDDILSVQSRLDQVRGEIEQLSAQLEQLGGLADLSTLTVTLAPRDEVVGRTAAGWRAGETLDQALAALVSLGQGVATVAIWLGVVGAPVVIGLSLVALIGLRLAPRLPGRRPSQPTT